VKEVIADIKAKRLKKSRTNPGDLSEAERTRVAREVLTSMGQDTRVPDGEPLSEAERAQIANEVVSDLEARRATQHEAALSDSEREQVMREVIADMQKMHKMSPNMDGTVTEEDRTKEDELSEDEFALVLNELLSEYHAVNPRAVPSSRPEVVKMTGWGQKFSLADTDRDGDLSETEREQVVTEVITDFKASRMKDPEGDLTEEDFSSILSELLMDHERNNPRATSAERPEWSARTGWGAKDDIRR